jgi:hypothetical protein
MAKELVKIAIFFYSDCLAYPVLAVVFITGYQKAKEESIEWNAKLTRSL